MLSTDKSVSVKFSGQWGVADIKFGQADVTIILSKTRGVGVIFPIKKNKEIEKGKALTNIQVICCLTILKEQFFF